MQHDKAIEAAARALMGKFEPPQARELANRTIAAYLAARRASLPDDVREVVLTVRDLIQIRQWFNALQYVAPHYLKDADRALVARLIEELAAKED